MDQHTTKSASLAELPLGAYARITAIEGGRDMTRRLLALGLRPGSEIRVEHHRGRGRVLAVGPTRVALGGGMVEKLQVEVLDPPPGADQDEQTPALADSRPTDAN